MPLAIATTFAAILWVTLWALGYSGFDSLLLASLIVLIVATIRSLGQYAPSRRRGPGRPDAPQGGW